MLRTPYPTSMEELRGKTCRHARRVNKRNRAAAIHNRAGSAWATGRSPAVRPTRIVAHSAEFARAKRRRRTATTDSPAWGQLEAVAVGSGVVGAAVDEAAVAVGAGRGETKS
jgi:hypothetical protein